MTNESIFPVEPLRPTPCTFSECSGGHRWTPRIAVTPCPGCAAPILATEMVNCPVCNEPAVKMVLRSEHITRQMGLQAVCKGETPQGDSGRIEIDRGFYLAVEALGGPRHPQEKKEKAGND